MTIFLFRAFDLALRQGRFSWGTFSSPNPSPFLKLYQPVKFIANKKYSEVFKNELGLGII
jgi:hypothetical protein